MEKGKEERKHAKKGRNRVEHWPRGRSLIADRSNPSALKRIVGIDAISGGKASMRGLYHEWIRPTMLRRSLLLRDVTVEAALHPRNPGRGLLINVKLKRRLSNMPASI